MESNGDISIWAIALIASGSALLGALVGGLSTGLLELWRQVVSGLAASRVIRSELTENATLVGLALDSAREPVKDRRGPEVQFRNEAWLQLRTAVAPLLGASALTYLASIYSFIPQIQRYTHILYSTGRDRTSEGNLGTWKRNLAIAGTHLIAMEASGRHVLLWRLLRPQKLEIPSLEEAEKWGKYLDEAE